MNRAERPCQKYAIKYTISVVMSSPVPLLARQVVS